MAALVVVDPFTRTSHSLNNVDLTLPLKDFKEGLCKEKDVAVSELEFMFLGQILNDDERSLQSYGIQHNTTIYILKKLIEKIETETPSDFLTNIEDARSLLMKAKNPVYKQSLKKLMKDKDIVEKILNENETLKKDRTIAVLLKDPDLSLAILESLTPERIINEYPMLGTALKIVLSHIIITDSFGRMQSGNADERDYEGMDPALFAQAELLAASEENIQQNQQQQQQQQQQQTRQISAADLANALSFASMNQNQSTGPSEEPSVGSSSSGNTSGTPSINFTEALSQMQAMGVTDEALSRRALMMSGGNVELALNLIFEGTLDN